MELLAIPRLLWRFRLLVLVGFVASLGAAYAVGPSPVPGHGYATTRVMFDLAKSQLVTDAPPAATTLPWRASVAGMLLGSDDDRARLAHAVGVPQSQLVVNNLELSAPFVPASLPQAAAQAANAVSAPYSVITYTDDETPIVSISVSAPDRAAAARLALAAVQALQLGVPTHDTAELLAMRVQPVSAIDAIEIPPGHGRKTMAAIGVVLFALWCGAIVFVPTLRNAVRTLKSAPAPA
jgi:hypothetical protein